MIKVYKIECRSNTLYEVLQTVHELKERGLKIGRDFEIDYSPNSWRINEGDTFAEFSFYKAEDATWFSLKYG